MKLQTRQRLLPLPHSLRLVRTDLQLPVILQLGVHLNLKSVDFQYCKDREGRKAQEGQRAKGEEEGWEREDEQMVPFD